MQHLLQRYQWHLYSIICGVFFLVLGVYLWPTWRLYASAETREVAVQLIERSAEHYALPRSDFFFTYIGNNEFRLCRREHRRGADPVICDWHEVLQLPPQQ